ncbi:hypothetical protein PPSIR1_11475 [Plesiocystis pacifica SIR-1]|uniref:Lipoprotein n=1 Tax=Plesiocystis pacifica SIR-1 TaxID=391625 RepID=A6G198_9BACT|nr:hypothetical protein [Plesiocystis pacifica]EDM80393.1 hypothetical protein PPSIR1_11475 [Plesiocystis pacifica SIR-1]
MSNTSTFRCLGPLALPLLLALGACPAGSGDDGGSEDAADEAGETGTTLPDGTHCAAGYTCWPDPAEEVVWVMKDDGNVNGPTCKSVCEGALGENCAFNACDAGRPVAYPDMASFTPVAEGLGFACKPGGCWDSVAPSEGLYLVSIDTDEEGAKSCYFPTETEQRCDTHPGNANCFGERYSAVCPCVPKPLDEACEWECPPNHTTQATWKTEGSSCVERINYWRKRACEEGWVECPPAGLPPMVECTACHECANSEAQYDSQNGAHASFGRCGEHVQGEGGGATCADVIDAFISERAPDENGVMRCQGHCGPIVAAGCQTFFWGKAQDSNFHTLNWRSCNVDTCQSYCDEHPGECFTHESSPALTCDDPGVDAEPNPDIAACG